MGFEFRVQVVGFEEKTSSSAESERTQSRGHLIGGLQIYSEEDIEALGRSCAVVALLALEFERYMVPEVVANPNYEVGLAWLGGARAAVPSSS